MSIKDILNEQLERVRVEGLDLELDSLKEGVAEISRKSKNYRRNSRVEMINKHQIFDLISKIINAEIYFGMYVFYEHKDSGEDSHISFCYNDHYKLEDKTPVLDFCKELIYSDKVKAIQFSDIYYEVDDDIFIEDIDYKVIFKNKDISFRAKVLNLMAKAYYLFSKDK